NFFQMNEAIFTSDFLSYINFKSQNRIWLVLAFEYARYYSITSPTFGLNVCPVKALPSGPDASSTTFEMISSTCPERCKGSSATSSILQSGSKAASIGVTVGPDATQLAEMPCATNSNAIDLVNPMTPALDAA